MLLLHSTLGNTDNIAINTMVSLLFTVSRSYTDKISLSPLKKLISVPLQHMLFGFCHNDTRMKVTYLGSSTESSVKVFFGDIFGVIQLQHQVTGIVPGHQPIVWVLQTQITTSAILHELDCNASLHKSWPHTGSAVQVALQVHTTHSS